MKNETRLYLGMGIVISVLLLAILGVQVCDTFLSSDVPFKAGDEIMYMFSSESKCGTWVKVVKVRNNFFYVDTPVGTRHWVNIHDISMYRIRAEY